MGQIGGMLAGGGEGNETHFVLALSCTLSARKVARLPGMHPLAGVRQVAVFPPWQSICATRVNKRFKRRKAVG